VSYNQQVSVLSGIAVIPILIWELSLGIYMGRQGLPAVTHPRDQRPADAGASIATRRVN